MGGPSRAQWACHVVLPMFSYGHGQNRYRPSRRNPACRSRLGARGPHRTYKSHARRSGVRACPRHRRKRGWKPRARAYRPARAFAVTWAAGPEKVGGAQRICSRPRHGIRRSGRCAAAAIARPSILMVCGGSSSARCGTMILARRAKNSGARAARHGPAIAFGRSARTGPTEQGRYSIAHARRT